LVFINELLPLPVKDIKFFPSNTAFRVALIYVYLALSQTPVYTASRRIRCWCVAWCVCQRPSFAGY